MSSQRRLGRGLEALLGRSLDDQGATPSSLEPINAAGQPIEASDAAEDPSIMSRDEEGQRWLDIGVIEANPYQPRKVFDEEEIADLADSIREHGVLQPLVVRRVEGRFELVAGERRLRAAQSLDWSRVPVQVRDLEDRQTAELALVENLQRKDLNPIEKAASFERYLRDYDCTQEELAGRVHINRSTVANLIRLLELPDEVKQMVVSGELTQGHARAVLSLPADQHLAMAKRVSSEGLSVRKTEQLVRETVEADTEQELRVLGEDGVSRQPSATRSSQIEALQGELSSVLGTRVELKQNAKGAGKITVHFADGDEFERLRSLLAGSAAPIQAAA